MHSKSYVDENLIFGMLLFIYSLYVIICIEDIIIFKC